MLGEFPILFQVLSGLFVKAMNMLYRLAFF